MSAKITFEFEFDFHTGYPESIRVTDVAGIRRQFTPENGEVWSAMLLLAEATGTWVEPKPWPECQGFEVIAAHRKRGGFTDGLILFAVEPAEGFTAEQKAWLDRAGATPYKVGKLGFEKALENFATAHSGQLCFSEPVKGSPLAARGGQYGAARLAERLVKLLPTGSTVEIEVLPYNEAYL